MNERVCVVEDDPTIAEFVSKKLVRQGYEVGVFDRAESVDLRNTSWDLYILDVMLGGRTTGLELCHSLRKVNASIPILILSALGEPTDRIEGLKVGADDYLSKPFEMEELLLRVQGMLKRRSWYRSLPARGSVYSWDDCSIDFVRFEGTRNGSTFVLSQKETMLMKLLIEREGETVSRDEILESVWGYDVYPSTRTVDNFILRLRKCFEDANSEPRFIQSIRGLGYRFSVKGKR